MKRWTRAGVIDRLFEELQKTQVIRIRIEAGSPVLPASTEMATQPVGQEEGEAGTDLDTTAESEAHGQPRFIWLPRKIKRSRALPEAMTGMEARVGMSEP